MKPAAADNRSFYQKNSRNTRLLVAKAVQLAAVRADPVDAVAGQGPEIFIHTVLAHGEVAMTALPAEGRLFAATVTLMLPIGFPLGTVRHVLFFPGLSFVFIWLFLIFIRKNQVDDVLIISNFKYILKKIRGNFADCPFLVQWF